MKEINIKVDGMVCGGCENRVKNAVSTIAGVEAVKANHNDGSVVVTAKDDVLEQAIKDKIEDIGFTVVK